MQSALETHSRAPVGLGQATRSALHRSSCSGPSDLNPIHQTCRMWPHHQLLEPINVPVALSALTSCNGDQMEMEEGITYSQDQSFLCPFLYPSGTDQAAGKQDALFSGEDPLQPPLCRLQGSPKRLLTGGSQREGVTASSWALGCGFPAVREVKRLILIGAIFIQNQ